jgi:hypothetical protein
MAAGRRLDSGSRNLERETSVLYYAAGAHDQPGSAGPSLGNRRSLIATRDARYRKPVIYVRGSNTHAQAFYRHLGFQDCGRLARQVMIDGVEDDEVLMELFL